MKFITRQRSEQSLESLAARAYQLEPAQTAAAAAALAARNPPVGADLARSPVGTALIVPELAGTPTAAAAEPPPRLAADQVLALRRALAEAAAAHLHAFAARAAVAATTIERIDANTFNLRPDYPDPNYLVRVRQFASEATQYGDITSDVATRVAGLSQELDQLLHLLGEPNS